MVKVQLAGDRGLSIADSEMTDLCRAALWYSEKIEIVNTKLHGIKALRECSQVNLQGCDIISPEFGWSVQDNFPPRFFLVLNDLPYPGYINMARRRVFNANDRRGQRRFYL